MTYLIAAYSVVWLLIAGYVFILGNRQRKMIKEIEFLQNLEKK